MYYCRGGGEKNSSLDKGRREWTLSTATTKHANNTTKNTRLRVSCPPSHHLTVTVLLLLGSLISIIFSETDRHLWMCLCERDTECECATNRTKHTDCSRGQELWMLAVLIHSLLLSLWIVWMSCYLLHDAPGSTCSNQICLLLPVRRRENPEEIPSSIGCLKHHGGGSTAMYVRSLWHRLHIHECSLLCVS